MSAVNLVSSSCITPIFIVPNAAGAAVYSKSVRNPNKLDLSRELNAPSSISALSCLVIALAGKCANLRALRLNPEDTA